MLTNNNYTLYIHVADAGTVQVVQCTCMYHTFDTTVYSSTPMSFCFKAIILCHSIINLLLISTSDLPDDLIFLPWIQISPTKFKQNRMHEILMEFYFYDTLTTIHKFGTTNYTSLKTKRKHVLSKNLLVLEFCIELNNL